MKRLVVLVFLGLSCGHTAERGYYSAFILFEDPLHLVPCGDYDGVPAWCYGPSGCANSNATLCRSTDEGSLCRDPENRTDAAVPGETPGFGTPCGDGSYCYAGDLCVDDDTCTGVICVETP